MGFADMARKALKVIRQAGHLEIKEKDSSFLDCDGGLVIPFGCDNRFHWWKGGQSVKDTIKELHGVVNAY